MSETVPLSPCLNVCVLDGGGICLGCGRTLDEIARWGGMSIAERWQVLARLGRERCGAPAGGGPRAPH